MRKLVIYGCDNFDKRKAAQEFLEKNGAIIDDYRFNFKERTVTFRLSLRVKFEVLCDRLHISPVYNDNFEFLPLPDRLGENRNS